MAAPHHFWDRVIDWASLDTSTKRVAGFGIALLFGLALLTALRAFFDGPGIFVVTYVVHPAALAIAGVSMGIAITLMLAGTAASRSRWRFLGLAALAGLCAVLMPVPGSVSEQTAWYAVYLLAAAGTLFVTFGNRLGAWPRTLAAAAAVVGGVALIAVIASLWPPSNYWAEIVVKLMMAMVIATLPAIIVVGWDLGEIAGEASAYALRRLGGIANRPAVWAAVASGLAIALALWLTREHHVAPSSVFYRAVLLGLLAILFVWSLRRFDTGAPHDPHAVGYFHVLFVAVLIALTMWGELAATRDAEGAFNARGGHPFSVELPPSWAAVHDAAAGLPLIAPTPRDRTAVHFAPNGRAGVPRLVVHAVPLTPRSQQPRSTVFVAVNLFESVEVALSLRKTGDGVHRATAQFSDSKGGRYTIDHAHVAFMEHGHLNGVFLFNCIYRLPDTAGIQRACDRMADSFQRDVRHEPMREARLFFNELVWILLALTCLVLLAARPVPGGSSIEFLLWVAIVITARNLATSTGHYHHEVAGDVSLSAEILAAALWLGAIALFVATVEASRSAALDATAARGAALSFLAALIVVALIFELYVKAAEASGHSHVIRGVIIVLALGWEFWTSGAMITNHDSTRYPRPARIMFYVGYLLVVATIVFYWVRTERAAGRDQAAFEAELFVAAGLVCLGLPFLLFRNVRAYLDAVRGRVTSAPTASPSHP